MWLVSTFVVATAPAQTAQVQVVFSQRLGPLEIGKTGPALPVDEVYSEFANARAEADRLRSEVESKRTRADVLQKAIGDLLTERAIQQQ